MSTPKFALVACIAYVACSAVPQLVRAADAADSSQTDASADTSGPQLQEVVVTATRREESIEKVPISISALSQQELAANNIKDIQDIAAVTPGLDFAATTGAGTPSTNTIISIRGLSTNSGASVVGVYLDDTPIQGRLSPVGNIGSPYPAVFDLSSVEVDRGPQGTLFGAGSEAGTVRFITNQPSLTQFDGFAHSEFGMTQNGGPSYELGAAAGGPIIDDELGFRVSAWGDHEGGYVNLVNPYTGQGVVRPDVNTTDKLATRAALTFKVGDAVQITPSVYYQSLKPGDSGRFYGLFSDPSDGQFNSGTFFGETASDHFALPSLKVAAHLPFAEFISTTSYLDRNVSVLYDLTSLWGAVGAADYGNPLGAAFPTKASDVGPLYTTQKLTSVTEEMRLASNQADSRLAWLVGIFLNHQIQRDISIVTSLPIEPTGAPALYQNQLASDQQVALFSQEDFHLTSKLTFTLGARVARTTSAVSVITPPTVLEVGVPLVANASLSETPFTPKFSVSYQVDPDNLLYASVGKGFRVGGGNAPVASTCDADVPGAFKSDYVWSYEIGAKDRLFDGRLQIDSSAFHINWSQIQQEVVLNCGLQYITNTGAAVSNGFDVGLQALMTDQLRFNLSLGYVDAYFTRDVYDQAGDPLVLSGDKIGLLPAVSPPWSVSSSAQYEIPLVNDHRMYVRGEYQFHSRNPGPFYTQIPSSPNYYPGIVANPATNLVNLRLGEKTRAVDVSFFVENLFNSHPLLDAYQAAPTENLITYSTFRPRTAGLSANVEF